MALLETWRNLAYGNGLNDKEKEKLWNGYFTIEKGIYEQILSEPTQVITGTVKELAEIGIECEPIRVDDYTGKKMTFFHDPDGLPLELHE